MSNISDIKKEFLGEGTTDDTNRYLIGLKNAMRLVIDMSKGTQWEKKPSTMPFFITAVKYSNNTSTGASKETAGQVCECTADNATRRLAEGTHRVSSKEEIERFRAEDLQREALCIELNKNYPEMRDKFDNKESMSRLIELMRANAEYQASQHTSKTAAQENDSSPDAPVRPPIGGSGPTTAKAQVGVK